MDAGLDTGSDYTDYEEEEPTTFIRWLIERPGTNWLCEVDSVFIGVQAAAADSSSTQPNLGSSFPLIAEDRFNLYGLDEVFPRFKQCIEVILGGAPGSWAVRPGTGRAYVDSHVPSAVAGAHGDLVSEAVDLYGMIHARFILTPRGLPAMASAGLAERCVAGCQPPTPPVAPAARKV